MSGCHDHCHVETEPPSERYRKVLWFALLANLAMFVVEVVAGFGADSVSLLADAVDFFGDAANYGVSLFVLGMGLSARAKATLLKGFSMAAFGVGILGVAVYNVYTNQTPEHLTMGFIAILALVTNVAVAVMLYSFREGDSNMRSVWLCSRNDAIGNVAVIIAAAAVAFWGNLWPDVIVAVFMAGLAITSAKSVIQQALGELRQGKAV
ncbi:MAG: cation transporter [Limnobacter sp.]|nr:cation transporter [Limnobacter sp.]